MSNRELKTAMHFKGIFLCFLLLLLSLRTEAQDIHFSNMHRMPLQISPALAGLAPSDIRFGGIYRNQWQSVPIPYTTFGAFFDTRLAKPKADPGILGAGFQALTDEAGNGEMRWIQGALSLSYHIPVWNFFGLSVGLQGAFFQRNFDYGLLTFDEQFDGDQFNPAASNGEDSRLNKLSYFSLGAGVNFRYKLPESRTKFDLGIGIHHLNRPFSSFLENDPVRISARYSPYLLGTIQVLPKLDALARAWWEKQGTYAQLVTGAALEYHLETSRQREFSLELGCMYRWKDALIPLLGVRFRSWEAGFSYDINLSDFQKATGRRGGPEAYFQYFITRVQPPPVFKACPIF